MWPWDELGLDPTDDERLIRKAYAERARQHRPDDDPDRFIRLRAAYDAALAKAAQAGGKVVQLDGFRDRPPELDAPPRPQPPRPEPPKSELPKLQPVAEFQPADEPPPPREPVTPRNARVRIERVGETGPAETLSPSPPASAKSKVRIERVAPETKPSPPPARPKVRIERVEPPKTE